MLCYYLVSPGGSDAQMQEALGLKVSQFVQLMGDEVPSEEEALRLQQEAREHIRILAEQLARRMEAEQAEHTHKSRGESAK